MTGELYDASTIASMQPTQTLPAEQALLAREIALTNLRAEHAVTRRVIDAIPIDKGDYSPDAVTKTAVDLAWHIVTAEHRFMDAVVTGVFDYSNTGRPASLANSAEISNWYAGVFDDDLTRVSAIDAGMLARPIDFRGIVTLPAVSFLMIGLKHSIHHRGQLSMYLRPMGATVPSIYGESYDSAMAKKAQA
jgi:uncharacterized damage-inducible protein DinB